MCGQFEPCDIEVFEEWILPCFKKSIRSRYSTDSDFVRARGKTPRPDIYIMHLERRKQVEKKRQ